MTGVAVGNLAAHPMSTAGRQAPLLPDNRRHPLHPTPQIAMKLTPRLLAAALASTLAWAGAAAQAQTAEPKVLNVYNWSDYIAEDTIKNFEKETGHQGPLRQLRQQRDPARQAGGRQDRLRHRRAERSLRQDADPGRPVPEAGPRPAQQLGQPRPGAAGATAGVDPGNQHLVTWLWGYVTVGINTGKVKAALGACRCPPTPGT
jgi:putrescine transport system substrate-binding protein